MSHAPTPRTVRPWATVWRARRTLRAILCAAALLSGANAAFAQEDGGEPSALDGPERAFLEGLRERRLADYAMLEIDRLAADEDTPAELKAALPYERALTLLALARSAGPGTDARTRLDEASALLEDFALKNPNNPLAGDAQFLRAEILQQAAADLLDVEDPVALPEETKTQARRLLEDAGRVYGDARRGLERTIQEIGLEQRDDAAVARRTAAEGRLIRARVEAARVVFRRAQTYPIGSPDRSRLLDEADAPLEELRNDFRRKIGALPGRIIQGQIRMARVPEDPAAVAKLSGDARTEAVKQLTTAAAILEEVVNQEPPAGAGIAVRAAVERLRGTAQRLRLSVLNNPLKADHQTVVTQATAWLDADRARGGSDTGAGVIFERGIAQERGAPAEDGRDRTRDLRAALADFQTAARRSEAVRGPATLAADRVREKLGLDRATPTKFVDAFDAAQALLRQLKEKQDAVAAAMTPEDKAAAQGDLDSLLSEIARLLNAANELADSNTDIGELSRARYLLAYVNTLAGRYYEAAVLAEYVAQNFNPPPPDPEKPDAPDQSGIPLQAATTAALAWTQAYQTRPEGFDGSFELSQLERLAGWIAEKYPDSDAATNARVTLGRVLLNEGELARAADAFAAIPESDAGYADAQLRAGDALWRRSLELARAEAADGPATPPPGGEDAPNAETLRQEAQQYLQRGVAKAEASLSGDAELSPTLVIGKTTLAQIYNGEGEFQKAVDELTGGKAKVQNAVAVAEGAERPDKGIKSAGFAKIVYQQLLRAQIGLKNIDAARQTIKDIQSVSTGGDVGVFVSLGRQIQEELEEIPPGPARDEARANLVSFLEEIAASDDQTFGSLMWVAETYAGLAETLPEGAAQGRQYYDAAAKALRSVVQNHLPEENKQAAANAVRLRLAEVLAGAGKFQEGYDQVLQVLSASENALNAQTVAANLLGDWGAAEGDAATLVKALAGDETAKVWGWGKISLMLAKQLRTPEGERFQADFNNARLQIPTVRAALAATKSGDEQTSEYQAAEKELLSWITLTPPDKIAPETRKQAEELYRSLQESRGVADPAPLPTGGAPAATPSADGEEPRVADAGAGTQNANSPAATDTAEEDEGPNVVLLVVGLVVLTLITIGGIIAFKPKPRKRAARRSTGKAGDEGATHAKMKGHGVVRSSLPDVAPIPAAVPAAAVDEGPVGTDFPDFSALSQKKASKPAAGTAPRTRSGVPSASSGTSGPEAVKRRRSSSSSSSGTSSSGKTRRPASPGAAAPDGKTVRRRSSSSGSTSSGSSGSSSSGSSSSDSSGAPRKRRPKPPSE
ncbi:coiled-coil domain-containing protein [Alienimonas californiensis]|uniref:Tetratricopeptide repeat protein n=1 Tax=Alienimonas californiensis TaxID=2527989 RepID=A0A517P6E0_9PLAN|nr:hypothetical protein [Alienimonas californiensis]QDT14947.1 hypothetical protein CA12_10270 [Alienimonas californiensis]